MIEMTWPRFADVVGGVAHGEADRTRRRLRRLPHPEPGGLYVAVVGSASR